MASPIAIRRLKKEYVNLEKEPVPDAIARPLETNILEWHFLLRGSKETDYEGGYYHGKIVFTRDYPMKPPSIMVITPSGRFEPQRKICMSMSDFHPESWNPLWSVGSIITGIISFMNSEEMTTGSVKATKVERQQFAKDTHHFNRGDRVYRKLFCPDLSALTSDELVNGVSMEEGADRELEDGLFEEADAKIQANQAASLSLPASATPQKGANSASDGGSSSSSSSSSSSGSSSSKSKNSSSGRSKPAPETDAPASLTKSAKRRMKEKKKKEEEKIAGEVVTVSSTSDVNDGKSDDGPHLESLSLDNDVPPPP